MQLRARKIKKPVTCARCDQSFKSWDALKRHSKTHLKTLDELKKFASDMGAGVATTSEAEEVPY